MGDFYLVLLYTLLLTLFYQFFCCRHDGIFVKWIRLFLEFFKRAFTLIHGQLNPNKFWYIILIEKLNKVKALK